MNNPSFYISIASTITLFVSEILPFIPIKSNGILHAILVCISKINITDNKKEENVPLNSIVINLNDINDIKNKLNLILKKIDEN